jgi:hypothetical protein
MEQKTSSPAEISETKLRTLVDFAVSPIVKIVQVLVKDLNQGAASQAEGDSYYEQGVEAFFISPATGFMIQTKRKKEN